MRTDQHPQWRGAKANYHSKHQRVYRAKGKASRCVFGCMRNRYSWACLTGDYDDIEAYVSMCYSCHKFFDLAVSSMREAAACLAA